MEQRIALVLLILLQLKNASSFSENPIDKGCLVKNDQLFNAQEADAFRVSFFITPVNPIKVQISFLGRKRNEDNDLLILEPNRGKIQRRRDDDATAYDITLNNIIPHGWNDLTINVADKKINIGDYYTHTGYKYDIDSILFTGKYSTNCTSKTPIWKIDNSSVISIPLTGLSSFGIRLYSNELFHPDLILNTVDIPLSYDEELVIRKSNLSLPQDDYRIYIEKHSNMISIFNSNTNEEPMLLMKAKMKENLIQLTVRSLEGSFFLILDPFQKNVIELETTVMTTTAENLTENFCKCEAPSYIEWKITTGIATGLAVILLLILMIISCLTKQNIKEEVHKVLGKTMTNSNSEKSHEGFTLDIRSSNEVCNMEEGDALLGNQKNVHIKEQIRLENTEPHGETNPNISPHHKEVCKLKLKSEKSKKIPGETDCRKSNKVILVVGQTGSGKSSFINAMINYIYGVTYTDIFRFKLIDDMDKSNASGTNNTDEITAYYIPYMPGIVGNCSYIFIDTPGFGDSRGIDEDKKWNHKFYKFLDENPDINEVDGICFVMKITDTRLTITHRYIINGLFSMFGKDIYKNIYAVVSYYDGSETQVPVMLKDSGIDYNIAIHFNSTGLFNDTEFPPSKTSEYIHKVFEKNWNLIVKNIHNLFNHLKKTSPVSLSLTNIVLEEYTDMEKLKDELLELKTREHCAADNELQDIQSKIEQNQELLNVKLDEAQKLDVRLKNITYKNLVNTDYIDILIEKEREQSKISELQKLKERNTAFNEILKKKKSNKRTLVSYILGEKTEKTE